MNFAVPDAPPPDEIFVNVASLVTARVPAWLKTAAVRATRFPSGGFTVGAYLSTAPDEHLQDILEAAERVARGDTQAPTDLNLLSLLLAQGEGLVVRSTDSLGDLTSWLLVLVQAERARRQRLLDFQPLQLSLESLDRAGLRLTRDGGRFLLHGDTDEG